MPTKNGQFEYPQDDWAVGKMAKIGPMRGGDPGREYRELMGTKKQREERLSQAEGGQYPEMDPKEWQQWFDGLPDGGRVFASPKDKDLNHFLTKAPTGFSVEKGHPGLKDLDPEAAEVLRVPNMGDYLFVKPKKAQPLTSEWEEPGPQRATG